MVALDDEYKNHGCAEAFSELIESHAPFVFLNKWDDLEAGIAKVLAEGVDNRQQRLITWYRTYWQSVSRVRLLSLFCLV